MYKIVKKLNTTSSKTGNDISIKKAYGTKISEGDRVLVCSLPKWGGIGKLRWYQKKDINTVVECVNDLPIFEAKRENNKNGKIQTFHRNQTIYKNKM